MTKNEAIFWFKNQKNLADFLNVAYSNVSQWKKIPRHHQFKIENFTKGDLKADPPVQWNIYSIRIQQEYIDMIQYMAQRQGGSQIKVIRDALKSYYNKFKY